MIIVGATVIRTVSLRIMVNMIEVKLKIKIMVYGFLRI